MIHMLISAISGKCTRNYNRTLITLPVLIVVRGLFRVMVYGGAHQDCEAGSYSVPI